MTASRCSTTRRGGFTLLTTLWVLVGASAVALALSAMAHDSIRVTANQQAILRARWHAEACAARALAAIANALDASEGKAWRMLDSDELPEIIGATSCTAWAEPTGTRLGINSVNRDALIRFLLGLGQPGSSADSLADALLDWRDADRIPRASGAEEEWYRERKMATPRDGPFAHVNEIRLVRGYDALKGFDSLLSVDAARILIHRAPAAVLRALPGLDETAIVAIIERRQRSSAPFDLGELYRQLPPTSQQHLAANYPALEALITTAPDEWILWARGTAAAGERQLAVVIEQRLRLAGLRPAVVRKRRWIE
jgi:general secretion pathway protein K